MLSHLQVSVIGSLSIIWIISQLFRKRNNPCCLPLPPGPKGYSIIGSLFDFPLNKPWLVYAEWFKKYNSDIIYFEALGQPFVIVNSLKRVNDLFEKRSSNYSDRVRLPMIIELMGWDYNFGLIPYGDSWRRHRRTFHQHFRPNAVEKYHSTQQREARAMLRRLLHSPEKFLDDVRYTFGVTIMKIVYDMDINEPNHPHILNAEEALRGLNVAGVPGAFLVDLIPALKYVPEWFPGAGFKRKAKKWRQINEEVQTKPFEHVKESIINATAKPCMSTRLIENLPAKEDPRREEEEKIAQNTSAVAYVAGADTTVSVVQAVFLALAMYPSVQKKAQAHIDAIVGSNRLPDFNDRATLPYINAMVKETLRWQSVVPLGFSHMATNEDEYDGYYIPKGTIVMGSSWEMLNDPKVFDNPEEYMPERYLTPEGKLNPNARDPSVAAFGFGRRICPGRHLIDNSLFIIIASLLAAYDIKPPLDKEGNEVKLTHEVTGGLLCYPAPFKCRITPRSPDAEALIRESGESD